MPSLIAEILSFPTVVFTVLFAVEMVYWLFVVLGAIDVNALGGGDAAAGHALEGVAKGATEGVVKGALEGVVKGTVEGAAKGTMEGLAHGDGHADGVSAGMFSLRLRSAPATVVLSVMVALSFLFSALAMRGLRAPWAAAGMPAWLLEGLVFVGSIVLSVPPTSLVVRPLGRLFVTHKAPAHKDLVGKVCVVSTGHVDGRFGQASLEDGGAGLLLPVRCESAPGLARGDRALIIGWDEKRQGFVVEPMRDVLESGPAAGARRG